jgi:hypothetical protein
MMNRREFLGTALGASALAVVAPRALRAAPPIAMTVYKSPSCGCCKEWIKHVKANGFAVKVIDMDDVTPMKRSAGVPLNMESCHTALVGKYVIEGHVPADLIKKILAEKPVLVGLSVPGMPLGAPGMEESGPARPYKVMAFMRDGSSKLYASRG